MQRMLRVIALAAMTIGIASGAFAQVANSGTIEVFVTDPQGQTLPGATVEASAVNTTTKRVAVTDENGKAVLELLEPSEVYTVKITMQGFKEQVRENQLVRVAQVLTIRTALVLPGVEEAVTVSAETTPLVDVGARRPGRTSRCSSPSRCRPAARIRATCSSCRACCPTIRSSAGNPASKSGVNYSDIGGALGVSSDNFYYFNGINVTDPVTGTFGSNLNTEDHPGTEGADRRHPGRVRRHARPALERHHQVGQQPLPRLGQLLLPERQPRRREQELGSAEEFSTFDAAFTIGGPVLREQGVVLRQLPPRRARGRRDQPRYAGVPAHGQERAGSGLRQGHVGADAQRHASASRS